MVVRPIRPELERYEWGTTGMVGHDATDSQLLGNEIAMLMAAGFVVGALDGTQYSCLADWEHRQRKFEDT